MGLFDKLKKNKNEKKKKRLMHLDGTQLMSYVEKYILIN